MAHVLKRMISDALKRMVPHSALWDEEVRARGPEEREEFEVLKREEQKPDRNVKTIEVTQRQGLEPGRNVKKSKFRPPLPRHECVV